MNSKPQKIGLITATSLVIGNMIGAGIFLVPSSLAGFGSISLVAWVFTAIGALILAKIFSNMSKIFVNQNGGPYIYSKAGFGDFVGFLVAWGYWISVWVSNAAVVIAIIGALSHFFPLLTTKPILGVFIGLAMIWLLTWVNSRGVKSSGKIQVITTILKLVPLIFVILIGIFFFDINNFPAFNLTGESNWTAISSAAAITLYAFLGVESASIPAGNVENPEKTVPRATMMGTIITTMVYLLSSIVLFGIIPVDELANSPKPFADAGKIIGGDFMGYFVAAGAAIAGIGSLNGWILLSGQLPMATAQDNMFPKIFKMENRSGAPYVGLFIGSGLTSLLVLMNLSSGLVETFTFLLNITVFTVLVPYLFVAAAYIIVVIHKKLHFNNAIKTFLLGTLGATYSIWAIFGTGSDTVFYGFLLLMAGIPFYVLMQWNKREK
ncbi:amino acid permease [Maribacter sp. HTCC2170]|uniref:amino acid permease n=1 Tax=Maribacter sp. (strain HTCC2170 / KCCM 42371) TaxID=313603 RepID=UPI00006BD555|nr:amino acid permease [Maribacter sp. HTCC2170]EAR02415.1 probable amino acid permease [Maribacter sp. HTCC2170]